MKATNIKWITDEQDVSLPNEIIIPFPMTFEEMDEDAVSDYISEKTGFLHEGFCLAQEYIIGADGDDLKELVNHLSMNGYHSKIEDNILLALEHEYKEIETILDDRDILFVTRGPIRQIDITREDISCCDELVVEDGRIDATYELWCDVDAYFGWQTAELDGVWYNFYTDWHPDGRITASYTVEGDSLYFHEEWELTAEEVEFFRNKMENFCKEDCELSLKELFAEITSEMAEMDPDYGNCTSCRHYSKCNICSDCHEGSSYEYFPGGAN